MKKLLLLLFLSLGFGQLVAAQTDTISTAQVNQFIGKEVVLKGKLLGIKPYTDRNGKNILFLDIDEHFPNTLVGVTVFSEALKELLITEELIGKMIYISGYLEEYKGKPTIGVNNKEQVRIE